MLNSSNKNEVTHTGIISEVGARGIKVKIGVYAGCANCHINGNCEMAEQADKELFIDCIPHHYQKGQRVEVRLKKGSGMNSKFLLYVLPFMVLLLVMLISNAFIKNETTIGILSLTSLLLYYFIILLLRNKIKKRISYFITPINV